MSYAGTGLQPVSERFLGFHFKTLRAGVQGQKEEDFPERMFIYHYRLFDRYGQRVISLAILGDNNKDWKPKSYDYELMGCSLSFQFPIVKLIDYKTQGKKLAKSNNPFAIVVRTHLKGIETHNANGTYLRINSNTPLVSPLKRGLIMLRFIFLKRGARGV